MIDFMFLYNDSTRENFFAKITAHYFNATKISLKVESQFYSDRKKPKVVVSRWRNTGKKTPRLSDLAGLKYLRTVDG